MTAQFRYFYVLISAFAFGCNQSKPNAPASFQIQEGYHLALVAAEPLLQDPVDIEFDEQGNTYVLEMPGYPMEDQESYIVNLKDHNKDGIYDEGKTVAHHLNMASSILPYQKGILVAAPPYLLHLKDSDGDGIFNQADTLMGGFSTGNLQHNFNGLTMGLDGWIYAANGGNSGNPYWWGDTSTMLPLRGRDFRIHIPSKKLERQGRSSGGFGLAMNEWGQMFETHNLKHISHLVFPERYANGVRLLQDHALENISDHEVNGLARIYPIGEQASRVNHPEQSGYFSGSCGITYYGGQALGQDMNKTVWVADVVLNLIHIDHLKANGSSWTASRMYQNKEFLASEDRSFRPVNMSVGPDGAMYVVDMYRGVIEHPEWIPDEIEKTLDLNAGKDKGRIYKITNTRLPLPNVDFKQLETTSGQISALKHPNQWMRWTAHRLLLDTDLTDKQTKLLQSMTADSAPGDLHSLWILSAKKLLPSSVALAALRSPSSGLREQALIMSESLLEQNDSLCQYTIDLLDDDDARVRMQAALTLSTLSEAKFNTYKESILRALITSITHFNDKWNIAAITTAVKRVPSILFNRLASVTSENSELLNSLAIQSGSSLKETENILETLNSSKPNDKITCDIIRNLTAGIGDFKASNKLLNSITALEEKGTPSQIVSLAFLRNKLKLPLSKPFIAQSKTALQKAKDRLLSDSVRLIELQFLELLPFPMKADVLYHCLDNSQPLSNQEAAIKQLGSIEDPQIGKHLISIWTSLAPQTRRSAGDLLLYKKIHHDALLTGLENKTISIGEMDFDLERRRTLLWWSENNTIKKRAEALFSDEGVTTRKAAIEKMKPALALTGIADKGSIVFLNLCSQCHVYGSVGKEVGPVLTEIHRKSKETLLHDILDPNAATDTRYINHKIETLKGDVHLGIIDLESDQQITLKQMGGNKITIPKSEIKSMTSLGTSLMVEGLEGNMTLQDLADLLTYLQQNK